MNNKRKRSLLIVLAILVVAATFCSVFFFGRETEDVVKIGFILSGSCEEKGWNGIHYQGYKASSEKLGTRILVKENVKEYTGECETAIHDLVKQGANMIILSSYGYSEEVFDVVQQYPQIVFYGNSSEYHAQNLTSYFARLYQARYMAGIVAGMKTKTNQIGYVAAMENNEVNRGINAFALGVRKVNPDAVVHVVWTDSWDNEQLEREAAKNLIEKMDTDVITYHQNQDFAAREADKNGVYSIGYHVPNTELSSKYLTAVVCNWEILYEEIMKQYLQGNANSIENYWIGLDYNAVGLSDFSDEVSGEILQVLEREKEQILEGKDVFSGVIYDNKGMMRCDEGEIIRDKVLLEEFDWFVEGVEIYEE